MLFLPLLMLINVNSYEDCENVEKEYLMKNDHFVYDATTFTNSKWVDANHKDNFTFIAENADDCKSRTLRKYTFGGDYYDNKADYNYKETFLTHCCFLSYDDMEKYEDPNEIEKEKDAISFRSQSDYMSSSYFYGDYRTPKVTKTEDITGKCIALTDNQYDNIKEYKKYLEYRNGKYINLKIDCNTSYLQFFMITLMLLFLL